MSGEDGPLTTAKNSLPAKIVERTLGTSYRTVWALLQRYRVAILRSERERLSGAVEVDETFVGGVEHGNKCGRATSKAAVVIAVLHTEVCSAWRSLNA